MKKIKNTIVYGMFIASLALMTSCSDWLELSPIDNFGSGSYWKTEAHAKGYIDGMHKHLRDAAWQHTIVFGELRGGTHISGTSSDGSSVWYGSVINQNFDAQNTGVGKFGDLFGRITNTNLFIARVTDADYVEEAKRDYYLGIAHGLRAFYYYDLYRVYGGVPLRLGVEVIDGELDPKELYLPRAEASEVMTQIKKDIDVSLSYFGSVNDFNPYGMGKKVYWSKAATEALAADVYLWNAKVSTGDNNANPADLSVSKKHLNSLLDNYGLKLQSSFSRVHDATNKANDEIIFAVRYMEGEATNGFNEYIYNTSAGLTNKNAYLEDGTLFDDPLNIASSGTAMRYEYTNDFYKTFDKLDSRRDATFLAAYNKAEGSDELVLRGTSVVKHFGRVNNNGIRIFESDMVYYRLPWVYLALAEIANQEGNNSEVEKYINLVRERAYGDNWDKSVHGFVAGDYTTNELAILHEKDKEFVQEGQRWWDLRRMTLTKGGTPLVFTKEGSITGTTPLLNINTEAHKVLWPLEKSLLDNDDALVQTPGYEDAK
ncbi:MAG: RagB/SusD family nutrient uptake outer membrane protein [Proteiniphilum sp.]|nr:RagB/SusD family nutrient uptake outer membrane protein [Proteiniphilum sp.]